MVTEAIQLDIDILEKRLTLGVYKSLTVNVYLMLMITLRDIAEVGQVKLTRPT